MIQAATGHEKETQYVRDRLDDTLSNKPLDFGLLIVF